MNSQPSMNNYRDPLYPSPDFMKKTSPVSSRLAKTEQKKMVKQTFLFVLGAVALLIAFIFVIVPGTIRLLSAFRGTSSPLGSDDKIPPQIPIFSAPVAATNSAQLKLSGFGEPESELVVLLNDQESLRENISPDGTFEVEILLNQGENQVSAFAVDGAKNESAESKTYTVTLDSEKPEIEISEPQDGQLIELKKNQQVSIKGKTEPRARITLNGRTVFANSEGAFSTTYLLQEGENKLQLTAEDEAGNSTQTELTVNFRF